MPADYSSARTLVRWSLESVDELANVARAFHGRLEERIFLEPDADGQRHFVRLRLEPVPDYCCKLASHALFDAKHALDHATHAAIKAIYPDLDAEVHFPIVSHPNDLEARLLAEIGPKDHRVPKYPEPLAGIIRASEPYPKGGGYSGGGDEFVILNRLANVGKHAVRLRTSARPHLAGAHATGGLVKLYLDARDDERGVLTLALVETAQGLDLNLQIAGSLTIESDPRVSHFDAIELLRGYAMAVSGIIDDIATAVP